jgi:ABC-type multidrug transport system ATPase subunit
LSTGTTGPEQLDRPQVMRGLALRTAALLGLVLVAVVFVVTASAYDRGRVDEAGLVTIGICCLGVLYGAGTLWNRARWYAAAPALPTPRPIVPLQAAGGTDAAIRVDGVTVRYGLRTALSDLSLHVNRGEIVALLGPNGAGKTTTVDVCCGLRKPDAGHASVLGYDSTSSPRDLRRSIGVVPQDTGLYPELTAAEYMRLFASMYGLRDSAARVEELLQLMGLWDRRNTRVGGFSGGMKRRLALSRALLHDPPVLFLDEPTLGVDVQGRRALWDHVLRLRDEGRSVLLTTNYLEEATALCDRVVILDEGVVLADASPQELRGRGGTTLTLQAEGDIVPVAAAIHDRCGLEVTVAGRDISVLLPDDAMAVTVIQAAAAVAEVTSLRTEQATLEEVFLRLTGRALRE